MRRAMAGQGVDSHLSLPVVEAGLDALAEDFEPFRRLVDLPMAMTAHVVYTAIDAARPATDVQGSSSSRSFAAGSVSRACC